MLLTETGLPRLPLEENVSWLLSKGLLVELEGYYIALALRPRDELVNNCMEQLVAGRAQAATLPAKPPPQLYPVAALGAPVAQS